MQFYTNLYFYRQYDILFKNIIHLKSLNRSFNNVEWLHHVNQVLIFVLQDCWIVDSHILEFCHNVLSWLLAGWKTLQFSYLLVNFARQLFYIQLLICLTHESEFVSDWNKCLLILLVHNLVNSGEFAHLLLNIRTKFNLFSLPRPSSSKADQFIGCKIFDVDSFWHLNRGLVDKSTTPFVFFSHVFFQVWKWISHQNLYLNCTHVNIVQFIFTL